MPQKLNLPWLLMFCGTQAHWLTTHLLAVCRNQDWEADQVGAPKVQARGTGAGLGSRGQPHDDSSVPASSIAASSMETPAVPEPGAAGRQSSARDPWERRRQRLEADRLQRERELLEFQRQHWLEVKAAAQRNREQVGDKHERPLETRDGIPQLC